jgi:hypothetical protein
MTLNSEQIQLLLKENKSRAKRGPRKDETEPRTVTVWFKLRHHIADFEHNGVEVKPHCENPDCSDPRPSTDRGRNVVSVVKGKMMCRYCFLSGWLSDA